MLHQRYLLLLGLAAIASSCGSTQHHQQPVALGTHPPPVLAPWEGLDTLATNDWWERADNPIVNMKVARDSVIAFGIYTVSASGLKLSAQLYPLYPEESRTVSLWLKQGGQWQQAAEQQVNDLGWSALFQLPDWDDTQQVDYQLRHEGGATYAGIIRANPVDQDELVMAAFSCNSNKDRGLRAEYISNIEHLDPDILFFAGDQSYDHKEHTAAWLKFGLQFGELFRTRPCITIPDDHDIGQGNLWGEGGIKGKERDGHSGGYFFHHEYVKMVERCQTAHLPDPFDATPIAQGIGVYYTDFTWGGVDLAVVEDRKFKTGPYGKIPQQGPRPDHINDPDYDPASIDVAGLKLLGDRQLAFLEDWGSRADAAPLRAVLSQTGFCGGAHIHGQPDNRLHADLDSNGWPQTGRNKAVQAIKAAGAVHIAGDQHLATVIQHGTAEFRDGPWAFVVPAVVNKHYNRWWHPADEQAGANPPNNKLPWLGDYLDGFDNKVTMHAYANPEQTDFGAGFGLIRFQKADTTVTFECWPRYADLPSGQAEQFAGWPITVKP